MVRRLIQRGLTGIVTLLLVSALVFVLIQWAPGSPVSDVDDGFYPMTAEERATLEAMWRLDQPLHQQYLAWVGDLLRGDLGDSIRDRRPVSTKIAERLPLTLMLNLMSLVVILLIAVPVGAAAALHPGSRFDRWSAISTYGLYAVPVFWAALLLQRLFAVELGWLPLAGRGGNGWSALTHLILPVVCLSYGGLAYVSRFVRTQLLESTPPEAVRSARARGMTPLRVLYRHGFRLAAVPMLTLAGFLIPSLIAGSVIVESVFQLPGLGRLFLDAAYHRDLPVLLGMTLLSGCASLLGILLADVAYALFDPRVRRG